MDRNESSAASVLDEAWLLRMVTGVRRQRLWLVACFVCVMVAAAAYLMLKPPEYLVTVAVRIGTIEGGGALEPGEILAAKMMRQHGEEVAEGIKRPPPFLKRATVVRGASGTLQLVVEGRTAEQSVNFAEKLARQIQGEHDALFQGFLRPIELRLQAIDAQRAELDRRYSDALDLITALRQKDHVQASLMSIELVRLSSIISELNAERVKLAQRTLPPQTQRTELLGEITAPEDPSSPKPGLVLGFGAALGLMLGVLAALLAEALKGLRRIFGAEGREPGRGE